MGWKTWEVERNFKVRLGGNTYIDVPNLIVYKDETLFNLKRHEDGYLGIFFKIYDSAGDHVATVKRNEIYPNNENKDAYILDGTYDRCTLTEKQNNRVICDIKKRRSARPQELEVSVKLYASDGFLIDLTSEHTNIAGSIYKNNTIVNSPVGIKIN